MDFHRRLLRCMRDGDLTVADLHHWFDRPRATVRTWVVDARIPRGPSGRRADLLLQALEKKIRKGLVVPDQLSKDARPQFIRKLRHAAGPGLSRAYSTG